MENIQPMCLVLGDLLVVFLWVIKFGKFEFIFGNEDFELAMVGEEIH